MKQNKIPRNEYIRKPVGKTDPYKGDTIYTDMGQWEYPGQVTKIPSGDITMQGVPYPVYGEDNLGYSQMMYPGMDYQFPGQYVTEYPQMQLGGLLKKGLTAAKKAVKNTYKINPWAEHLKNPNSSYRVAGLDAYDDFKNIGVLRSVSPNVPKGSPLMMRMMYRPTSFPSFQKGYADLRYLPDEGGVIFKTDLPTFKRGEINPVTGFPIKGRHYAHRVIDPKTGATMTQIPGANVEAYSSEPHWLKGYMKLPKQAYGGDPSLPNIEGHYPFGGMHTKTHTHFKTGGWLDKYPEGGEPTGTAPASASSALSEDEFIDKYTQAYEDLENEKKRVASVREKVAMIAANKAKSKNKKTRTDLSYLKKGAFYCNTHTGECFQDAGATTPEGKKVPVIPGNLQWDSLASDYGFEWVDKPEPGDIAREQLYRDQDYQGKSLSPGWYTSHSGVVTQVADPNNPEKIKIANAPGGSRFLYENQSLPEMVHHRNPKDYKMKYQRYVGNIPVYNETFEELKKQLTPTNLPSKDITSLADYTTTEEPDLLRYGGLRKNKQTRNKTSKNIASSINKLFLRNYDLYGPSGKNVYDPKSKYQDGGANDYSIVDYLISKGINPSKENRALLAKQSGIKGYDYTADKNLELLDALKQQSQKPKVQEVKKPVFTPYFPQKVNMPSETTQRSLLKNKPVVTQQDVAMAAKPAHERAAIRQAQLANKVPKKEDILQQKQEQSTASKAWDVALNPLTAFGAYNKYGYLPDNFTESDGNLIDQAALSVVNPAFYANALGKTIGNVFSGDTYKDIPKAIASGVLNLAGDQVPEGYDEAAMRTAGRFGDALVGAQGLGFAKTIPRSIRDTKYDNVLTLGKGPSKQTFKNSADWMDAYKAESAATGKQRALMKKEVDFLNKEIKQRGILEASRRHPLDPRSALSKALIIPEEYNFGKVLKQMPKAAFKTLTEGSPESLYTMGQGRVAGWNQYLGKATKNNPYRIHPESFTNGEGLLYTVPESEIAKLQKANLSAANAEDMVASQMMPAEGIKELSFYKQAFEKPKNFDKLAYDKVYDDMINAVDQNGEFLYSTKDVKKLLGPKSKFKYDINKHRNLLPDNDIPDWTGKQGDVYRTADWDKYIGSHGNASWNVTKAPNNYEKWSMEDVWDINPLSRMQQLPFGLKNESLLNRVRNLDAGKVLGGKDFKVKLDYFAKPGGKNVIPAIPKAKGGETEWLDKAQDGKQYSDAEANYLNRKAYEESLAQSRKDYVKDFVKQGTQEALLNSPFNFIASFTPAGVPIYLSQSALSAGQNVANKEYFDAGLDALFAAPLLKGVNKTLKPAIKKAGKLAFRGYKAGGWLDKYNNF